MSSKRFNNLPNATKAIPAEVIEKLISTVKKKLYNEIWRVYWFKFTN